MHNDLQNVLSKRVSRLYAVQILYQLSFVPQNVNMAVEVFLKMYSLQELPKANLGLVYGLVSIASTNEQKSKHLINSLSSKYTWSQLEIMVICILRVAIAELELYPCLDKKIILSEYTLVADSFLTMQKVNLVNALLQQVVNNVALNNKLT